MRMSEHPIIQFTLTHHEQDRQSDNVVSIDGRIDKTTIRVVILDPTLDKEMVDLTKKVRGVKLERQRTMKGSVNGLSPLGLNAAPARSVKMGR